MKRVFSFVVTALALAGSPVQAQNSTGIPDEAIKALDGLVGTWKAEGKVGEAEQTGEFACRWRRGPDGKKCCLVGSFSYKTGETTTAGITLIGWNAARECIEDRGFDSDGRCDILRWYPKTPGEWNGEWVRTIEGEEVKSEAVLVRKGPAELVMESESEAKEPLRIVFKKVAAKAPAGDAKSVLGAAKKKPKMNVPGPDYEHLKAMEWMIGNWEAEWVVPSDGDLTLEGFTPGARVRSTTSTFWMENRNNIAMRFRGEIDGKLVNQGFELVGVDPGSKKKLHWLFSNLGGWGKGEWSVDGETHILTWSGTTADGTELEGVGYMVPIDADTYTWQLKHNKKNGKEGPDTPVVTFRRVKSK